MVDMANAAGRARLIAAAVSMLLVGAVVPARAASDVSHDRWDDVFVEPAFCGSRTVTIHDVGHGTTRAYESDEGFPLFAGTVRATVTFTDTDGDAVRSDVAWTSADSCSPTAGRHVKGEGAGPPPGWWWLFT
jgi:hypothetical protein